MKKQRFDPLEQVTLSRPHTTKSNPNIESSPNKSDDNSNNISPSKLFSSDHEKNDKKITFKNVKEEEDLVKQTKKLVQNPSSYYSSHIIPKSTKEIINKFNLIKYEKELNLESAYYGIINDYHLGHLILTEYRIMFKFENDLIEDNFNEQFFNVPLCLIAKVDKSTDVKLYGKYIIDIVTKDNRNQRFIINNEQYLLYLNLVSVVFQKDNSNLLNFSKKYRECSPVNTDGWLIYNPLKEYQRQGIDLDNDPLLRLTKANQDFALCPTYPRVLVVNRNMTDEELNEAANFRTKRRLPVFAWRNKEGNSIWRSSQTKSGITQQRNKTDEKLLKIISESGKKILIYDGRPYISALANRLKGGGFEIMDYYENCEIIFCEIDNIHAARNSLNKLYMLFPQKNADNKKYLSLLEQSLWYEYIHYILKAGSEAATSIQKRNNILVHCSDGWDRCTQIVSLAQIFLDPYFRTIEGLIIIIEKEWVSFGHQFARRNGLCTVDKDEDQRSPIFLQFLDCIHQLLVQFPDSFEFNMDFIMFLAQHHNSCLYGTFLHNNELEMEDKNARQKTVSIWTDVYEDRNFFRFLNPFYKRKNSIEILQPNYNMNKLRLWEEYFLRWVPNNTIQNSLKVDNNKFYESHKKNDIKMISELQKQNTEMTRILKEISQHVLESSVYDEFSDETRSYLNDLCKKEANLK